MVRKERKDMDNIKIVSINCDDVEVTNEHTLEEWKNDWWGECMFCPTNNDSIIFVSINEKEISLEEISDKTGDGQLPVYFEHVARYLKM